MNTHQGESVDVLMVHGQYEYFPGEISDKFDVSQSSAHGVVARFLYKSTSAF